MAEKKKLKLSVFSDLIRVSTVVQKGKKFEPGQHSDPILEAFHVPTVLHRTVDDKLYIDETIPFKHWSTAGNVGNLSSNDQLVALDSLIYTP